MNTMVKVNFLLNTIQVFIINNKLNLLRWFLAGLFFMLLSSLFLYIFVDILKLSIAISTFLTAEISTFLRFFINHYWVFKLSNPTIRNCIKYHFANGGAFIVWWITANLLSYQGIHYLVAGICAICLSTIVSLSSNFLWVWRKNITSNN